MIFIIGGRGFVGSAYARWCDLSGAEYKIITRENYNDLIGAECDLLINANGNSSKILSVKEPMTDFDMSVRSVRKSLVDFKADCYVHLSSCDVYPDCSSPQTTREDAFIDISRQSPYGFHKYLAEQCVMHGHKNWLIFRMGGFIGPGMKKNAIFDILKGDTLWLDPASELQYINTDTAAGLVMEIVKQKTKNEIFNLCGDGLIKLEEVIQFVDSKVRVNPGSSKVRYQVSTDKIKGKAKLPSTRDMVFAYLQSSLSRAEE